MNLNICVYNRSGQIVFDPDAMAEKATGLRFSSRLSGGYMNCTFSVPMGIRRKLIEKLAYRVAIRYGMQTCWEGRIAELAHGQPSCEVKCFGLWQHLLERRATYPYDSISGVTENANDIIIRSLRMYSPLVGGSMNHVQNPGQNLGGMGWKDVSLQKMILDICETGSEGDTKPKWFFAVWDSEAIEASGASSAYVTASENDAYDALDGSEYSVVDGIARAGIDKSLDRYYRAGFRFVGMDIPRYAHISSAKLKVYIYRVWTTEPAPGGSPSATPNVNLSVGVSKQGNAPSFNDMLPSSMPNTSYDTIWAAGNAGEGEYEIDITQSVQSVVDLTSWSSGNSLAVLISQNIGNAVAEFETWDAAGEHPAYISVDYGPPSGATMRFPPHFFPQDAATRENTDYIAFTTDMTNLSITETTDGLYNAVRATYQNSLVSGPQEDADSIAKYDRRENDPASLTVSGDITQADSKAETFLAENKDPHWRSDSFTVTRMRSRYGNFIPLPTIRPGCVVRLADMPTFDPDNESCFYILETEYDAEQGTLTLRPSAPTTVVGMLGEGTENIPVGPFDEYGIISAFDKERYKADVEIGGAMYYDVDVAHEIGWWLPVQGASCVVRFKTIVRSEESAVVTNVYGGRPPYDPHMHPVVGHRHDGELEGGGPLS